MTDLDTRIRDAVAEVAAAQEPSSSAAEVLRRLEAQSRATRRRFGARAVSVAAVVLLVLVVAAVVLVRGGAPGRDDAPVHVGPGPATTEPPATVTPSTVAVAPAPSVPDGVIPSGWHDWGTPPELAAASLVQVVAVGQQVVAFGGPDSTSASDQTHQVVAVLDVTTGAWRALPDPHLPPGDPSNIVGGSAMGDRAAFWKGDGIATLDLTMDRWTSGATAPRALTGSAVWTGSELVFVTDGLRYRPATDEWTAMADPPPGTRWSATWDGHEVIAAGLVSEQIPGASQAFAYDPASDRWRRLADPPLDGQALDLTWTGRQVVGVDYSMGAATYDPATDRWSTLPDMPLQAGECEASVRPMGDTVMADACGGDVVLRPDGTWQDVTDGLRGSPFTSVGAGVASFGVTRGGRPPSDSSGVEEHRLWTYGP